MATQLSNHGAGLAVVMMTGGWVTPDAVLNYSRMSPEAIETSYHEAMQRAKKSSAQGSKSTISLEEYSAQEGTEGPVPKPK
jgi:hypothetical protein